MGIVGGSLLLGVLVPSVTVPLGLVGSTCSPLIVFILPSQIFLHMRASGAFEHDRALSEAELLSLSQKATAMLWTGYFLIPLCSVIWVLDQV